MTTENWLVTDNPVSQARAMEGFSLERLGKVLGVSKQYLSRAEQGNYVKLNRDLLRWVSRRLDIPVREVERQYTAFQSRKRERTARNLAPAMLARRGSKEPGHVLFQRWRSGYWSTPIAFAKDMCVNPANVENYEEGITTLMPLLLLDALREVKMIDPNWIDVIPKQVPRQAITSPESRGAARRSESL